MIALYSILIFALALALRIAVIWRHRHRGCDAYYFLLCSEVFKKEKRIPIILPEVYTLEKREQWYPPGFSVFLSIFPRRFLDKHYWLVSPVVDALIAVLVVLVAYAATGNWIVTLVAGVLYSMNTASMVDCTSLNSRPLGALLFSLTILCAVAIAQEGGSVWLYPAVVFGAALLLTHKLSAQLLYVLLPFMAIVTMSWYPAFTLAIIVLTTLILSNGFLIKIWRGQYDILSFWKEHWSQLGAHPIHSSPAYPGLANRDRTRVHGKGVRGLVKAAAYLGMNAFVLVAIWPALHYGSLTGFDQMMLWWAVGTYGMAALTQLVPAFRFAGEGYRYLKLGALPVCYLASVPLLYPTWQPAWVYPVLLAASIILGIGLMWKLLGFMSSSEGTTIPFMDTGITDIVEELKKAEVSNILCVPDSVGDAVGYYTRKRVLRGTHNVPFKWVKPFFPVHRLPLDYLAKGYDASHIVVLRSYVEPSVLGLTDSSLLLRSGEYDLYDARKAVAGV